MTTFRWHFEITCSFYVLFIPFHSIAHYLSFSVGGMCEKKTQQYSRTSVDEVLSHRLTKRFSAGYFVTHAYSKTPSPIFFNPLQRPFDDDDQQRFLLVLNSIRKCTFSKLDSCFCLGRWAKYEFIHSIGPTSYLPLFLKTFLLMNPFV